MAKKHTIKAKDLYRFEFITSLELSPDGKSVVYTQQRVDRASEKKYQNLWLAPTGKGKPRQFTYGDQVDSSPHWSPDGKTIAFLSNRGDAEQSQLYLISMDGGEARPLTQMQGSFGGFQWSPDSKHFLVHFTKLDKDAAERRADEGKKKLGIVARHTDRIHFKLDAAGYLPTEQQHLWLVNARSGKAEQLTDHKVYTEYSARFSPDGKHIVFMSNRTPDPDRELFGDEIYVMRAKKGAEMREIKTYYGSKGSPVFSPDGSTIAFLSFPGTTNFWENAKLSIVPASGEGSVTCLTEKQDIHIGSSVATDVIAAAQVAPVWSRDGSSIYVQTSQHGSIQLRSVDVATGAMTALIDQPGVVGTFNLDRKQEKLAYYWGAMRDPNQVRVLDLKSGKIKDLTQVNRWLKKVDLGELEEMWFKGPDGNDLQGWILKPPGFSDKKVYPSILEIHGGPMTQYGHHFMHEFYYLAAQGYVVYFTNPRGGFGYGREHTKAIIANMGDRDYADMMAWADIVEKLPYIDNQRMGVTGGSYGGYMTAWIIGSTNRFAAAVAQRAVTNWVSMMGSSDFNWRFNDWMGDIMPWDGEKQMLRIWRQSPMSRIGKHVKTPTMVIHSQMDQRVEQEQGEQLYVALRYLGIPTKLVLFPDSPHGLSRTGRTDRRVERLRSILRWMDTYLKTGRKAKKEKNH